MPLNERALHLAGMIKNSSFRMKELIENILDFASGRLGEGIVLNKSNGGQLNNVLNQVVNELHINRPGRVIQTDFSFTNTVNCDSRRIGQLFSNLLSNALTYGDSSEPVIVTAKHDDGFELSVANKGKKIPDEVMEHLFKPFSRGSDKSEQGGLGLGLYISSEIARAHDGTLDVTSTDDETCFTLRMPVSV